MITANADDDEIRLAALEHYGRDSIMIDVDAPASREHRGAWIPAWIKGRVWVADQQEQD